MKFFAKNLLNRIGYDVIKLRSNNFNIESNLLNIIKKKNIECLFDVGANSGQYGNFLRQIGYTGYILSFEPVSRVFEKLKSASQNDTKWRCFQFALGDQDEKKEMNVYDSTVFSSFLRANDYSRDIWNSLEEFHTEVVQVK